MHSLSKLGDLMKDASCNIVLVNRRINEKYIHVSALYICTCTFDMHIFSLIRSWSLCLFDQVDEFPLREDVFARKSYDGYLLGNPRRNSTRRISLNLPRPHELRLPSIGSNINNRRMSLVAPRSIDTQHPLVYNSSNPIKPFKLYTKHQHYNENTVLCTYSKCSVYASDTISCQSGLKFVTKTFQSEELNLYQILVCNNLLYRHTNFILFSHNLISVIYVRDPF
jgi:hypothetical protein